LLISQIWWLNAERLADVGVQRNSSDESGPSGRRRSKVMGGQRQSSSIRQQREMSRKLKAAEKRAKRQSRTTEKPKDGTENPKIPK
jgi:hypothetical protein